MEKTQSKVSVLFKKHKKHLPEKLQGTWFGELCRYGWMIFISAWILQGMRIMNWREVVIKLGLDIFITFLLWFCGLHWIISLLIAHTVNFTFNGQLFAMFTHMGATGVPASRFLNYTIKISESCHQKTFLRAAIAYGSLSRGCYKSTSDIDLRLIPQPGAINWWKTALWALSLRAKAFVFRYPLDMYVYDPEVVVKKMRTDELPIILDEKDESMKSYYPERVEMSEFVDVFSRNNL